MQQGEFRGLRAQVHYESHHPFSSVVSLKISTGHSPPPYLREPDSSLAESPVHDRSWILPLCCARLGFATAANTAIDPARERRLSMKVAKGSRRRSNNTKHQSDLHCVRNDTGSVNTQFLHPRRAESPPGSPVGEARQRGRSESRNRCGVTRALAGEVRRRSSPAFFFGDDPGSGDSYGEDRGSSLGGASTMTYGSRLALAERALAEMMAQRDEAREKLAIVRRENNALNDELERAQSYQALYCAAQKEHDGMKASLATSTQICMDQQKLIQMLQLSPSLSSSCTARSSALDGDIPPPCPEDAKATLPPRPPLALRAAVVAEHASSGGGVEISKNVVPAASISKSPSKEEPKRRADVPRDGDLPDLPDDHSDLLNILSEQKPPDARRAIRPAAVGLVRGGKVHDNGNGSGGGGVVADGNGTGNSNRTEPDLLEDDLISHSSLRRAFDETFLNQPLRRRDSRRRDHQQEQGHHPWAMHAAESWRSAGVAGSKSTGLVELEGGGLQRLDNELEAGLLANHIRARTVRGGHARENGRGHSASQSSASTVTSTNKSTTKTLGERSSRKVAKARAAGRDKNSGRAPRGSSPCRPTVPRQARAVQRLSSGTSSSISSVAVAAAMATAAAAATTAAATSRDAHDFIPRRRSASRLSSRKYHA